MEQWQQKPEHTRWEETLFLEQKGSQCKDRVSEEVPVTDGLVGMGTRSRAQNAEHPLPS